MSGGADEELPADKQPTWDLQALWEEHAKFAEAVDASLRRSTAAVYKRHSAYFLEWLAGDYHPERRQLE
jgi:hypothetical protein